MSLSQNRCTLLRDILLSRRVAIAYHRRIETLATITIAPQISWNERLMQSLCSMTFRFAGAIPRR